MLEEAAKRDHRKLGREMDLFHFEEVAPGSSLLASQRLDNLFQTLIAYMRRRQEEGGLCRGQHAQDIMTAKLWEAVGPLGELSGTTCSSSKPRMTANTR